METLQIHRRVAQLQMPKLQKGEETYEWILKLCPNLMTPSQFLPDEISIEPKDVWFDTGVLEPYTLISGNIDRKGKSFHLKLNIPKMFDSNKLKAVIHFVKTPSIKFLEGEEIIEECTYPDPLRPSSLEKSFALDICINTEEFWKDEIDAISVSFVVEFETEPMNIWENLEPVFEFKLFSFPDEFRDSFCDVSITCEDEEFKAHKFVLSAMSPVFKKMFECGLKEEQEGRISILDTEQQTLKTLLDGIYSGKIDSSQLPKIEDLVNLFKASHQYCIDLLKDWTAGQIGFKINVGNALDIYRLGRIYENEGLESKSLELIKKEKKTIFHDPSVLRGFMNENPQHFKLIHELLINQ